MYRSLWGLEERVLDPLGLELQAVRSYPVGVENQSWVICKSSKHSLTAVSVCAAPQKQKTLFRTTTIAINSLAIGKKDLQSTMCQQTNQEIYSQ